MEDGRLLSWDSVGHLRVWDLESGTATATLTDGTGVPYGMGQTNGYFQATDDRFLTETTAGLDLWDTKSGTHIAGLLGKRGWVVMPSAAGGSVLMTWGQDRGTHQYWNLKTGTLLATVMHTIQGDWAVTDPEGRFDTADIGRFSDAHWVRSFDQVRPLPLTTFSKGYYTPGLLSRILSGGTLPPVKSILALNVLTPEIELSATPSRGGDGLDVTAKVCARTDTLPMLSGPEELDSGAEDLRVFLNGSVVAWKDGTLTKRRRGCMTHRARVQVPAGPEKLTLSAYAFNTDQVKSESVTIAVDNPRAGETPKPRAVLVHVGVDDYAGRSLDLSFARADAEMLSKNLAMPGREVHRVLLAEGGAAAPTKANLQAVLAKLAGETSDLPWLKRIPEVGPDDLVVLSFAGHGYAPEGGAFHLMLSDLARGAQDKADLDAALPYAVSEHELTAWLRPVMAGEMALVVDACQSAASVEGEGFQPGPLGSKGFGQLAYDKGMLVLAASQSDAVALEDAKLGHGLLTWVLVEEGLRGGKADVDKDGKIRLKEWLSYAEGRVPDVADAIARGEPVQSSRGQTVQVVSGNGRGAFTVVGAGPSAGKAAPGAKAPPAQQPRLFSYGQAGQAVVQ
jgi:hypothetical protein